MLQHSVPSATTNLQANLDYYSKTVFIPFVPVGMNYNLSLGYIHIHRHWFFLLYSPRFLLLFRRLCGSSFAPLVIRLLFLLVISTSPTYCPLLSIHASLLYLRLHTFLHLMSCQVPQPWLPSWPYTLSNLSTLTVARKNSSEVTKRNSTTLQKTACFFFHIIE